VKVEEAEGEGEPCCSKTTLGILTVVVAFLIFGLALPITEVYFGK